MDCAGSIPLLDDTTQQEAEKRALRVHHGKGVEIKATLLNHIEDFADGHLGADGYWVLDETMDVVFHTRDLLHLIALLHIVVDEAKTAAERHGDGHRGFGNSVHIRRDDGDMELERWRECGIQTGLPREDV